jgi:hypothetical protein
MKFSLASLALLLSMGTAAYATDVPPIVAPYPNHVALGEAADTLTSPSMVNRQVLPFAPPGDKTLFKEIVPCRLTDSRGNYLLTPHTEWVYGIKKSDMDPGNDCAGKLPDTGIVALTIQITSYNDGTTNGHFMFLPPQHPGFVPQLYSVLQNATAFLFYENGRKEVVQAGTVQIGGNYMLNLWNEGGVTNLTIDVLGYHVNDPLVGATGAGSPGAQGIQGIQGPPGANGVCTSACASPWACYSSCGSHAADTGRTALWPHCTVTLTGVAALEIHYVSDGVPAYGARAKNAGSVTFSADTNSTYCVLTLADPQN